MDEVVQGRPATVFPSLLDGEDYSSDRIFRIEIDRLFERSWLFAGTTASLPNENDFLLLKTPDRSVIVGRYGGRIKAFENRCPHRSSRLHDCDSGNRPLKCPFHGWTFDADGVLHGVPGNSELFGFSETERKKHGLRSFETESIGDLIFVRMPGCRRSLHEELGTMFDALTAFDARSVGIDAAEELPVSANWKLLVETALEAYHTDENHPLSLGANGQPPVEMHQFTFMPNGHQILNIGNDPNRGKMTSAVTILFVFPNLFAIQLDENVSAMLSFHPGGFDRTTVRALALFDRRQKPGLTLRKTMVRGIYGTNLEDRRVCERVQSQIRHHRRGQPLGAVEEPLHRFHGSYRKKMRIFPLARLFGI